MNLEPELTRSADGRSPNVLSVSSLNKLAKSLLESNFPAVIVEGEISNLAQPASGHWYLTLKDKQSQLRCAMFVSRNRTVRFKPANGNQVILRGRLSIYEGRGDYQLIVDSMEEAGDGALRRAFEELKRKLQAEGLFEEVHKQEVYSNYEHIGIVTSATGAAIRDIVSVFARRFPATRLTLFATAVQGRDAPNEIVHAIKLANKLATKLGLQALIVGRGGGSLEDLQAFNEEIVARAIYSSELPVTSAVGHEIDFTIADFVADLRAPTPSAAAELMSPDQMEYFGTLTAYQAQFLGGIRNRLKHELQHLSALARHLKRPERRLQEQAQHLDRLETSLGRAIQHRLSRAALNLNQYWRGLKSQSPVQQLTRHNDQLQTCVTRIRQSMRGKITAHQAGLSALSRNLHAVSPLQTIARGFSITTDESGELVRDPAQVGRGSKLTSVVGGGQIKSTVDDVVPITDNNGLIKSIHSSKQGKR